MSEAQNIEPSLAAKHQLHVMQTEVEVLKRSVQEILNANITLQLHKALLEKEVAQMQANAAQATADNKKVLEDLNGKITSLMSFLEQANDQLKSAEGTTSMLLDVVKNEEPELYNALLEAIHKPDGQVTEQDAA